MYYSRQREWPFNRPYPTLALLSREEDPEMKFRFRVEDSAFKNSSWSKNNPKTCVAVAIKPDGVAIRNSNDKTKNTVFFTNDEWSAFVKGVKNNEFEI